MGGVQLKKMRLSFIHPMVFNRMGNTNRIGSKKNRPLILLRYDASNNMQNETIKAAREKMMATMLHIIILRFIRSDCFRLTPAWRIFFIKTDSINDCVLPSEKYKFIVNSGMVSGATGKIKINPPTRPDAEAHRRLSIFCFPYFYGLWKNSACHHPE